VAEGWITVGRLSRTRGNRGELLGEIYSAQPGRAEKLKEVMLDRSGRQRLARIERVWHHGGRPVFKFAGIDSISEAELWEGADVLAPESERAVPEEGEYAFEGLIGCRMLARESGEPVGSVAGIEEYGGPPLLRVRAEDGREILVPFARSICKEIDVDAKVIRVDLPEGLTELS